MTIEDDTDDDVTAIGEVLLTTPSFARVSIGLYGPRETVEIQFVSRRTFDGPGLFFAANIEAAEAIQLGELLIRAGRELSPPERGKPNHLKAVATR